MAKQVSTEEADLTITENEGAVLSLIARSQPITRHRLTVAFRQSPTASSNKSKGTIYPLISRMIDRGLVQSTKIDRPNVGDALRLTEAGNAALSNWLISPPSNSFGHDPLLDRILALGGVGHHEQLRWIAGAKELLLDKKAELKEYRQTVDATFIDIAHGSAVAVIDAKLEWLDRLLIEIMRPPSQ